MTKRNFLLISILFISSIVIGQSHALPSDHPVAKAAPHLPLMLRFKGSGTAFYGEKNVYQKEQNTSKLI